MSLGVLVVYNLPGQAESCLRIATKSACENGIDVATFCGILG